MLADWQALESFVDAERFDAVSARLSVQLREARWWRDACLAYFSERSGRDLPEGASAPAHSLEYYKSLEFPNAPGQG